MRVSPRVRPSPVQKLDDLNPDLDLRDPRVRKLVVADLRSRPKCRPAIDPTRRTAVGRIINDDRRGITV
jgi:hypothetical protein